MKINRKIFFVVAILILGFFCFSPVFADDEGEIDYGEKPIVDSDLDGLTDLGEQKIFNTNPTDPDSDSDGMLDGTEVIHKTDPLDATLPSATKTIENTTAPVLKETSWPWYLTRASALVGFALLYVSIFLGLSVRIPGLNRIIKPIYSLETHCWISLQALIFALIHGTSLLFDKVMHFSLADILIPFVSNYKPSMVALGIISFYLMALLVVTSYARKFIPQKLWRFVHFGNIFLYAFSIVHALNLGTDLKIALVRSIFIYANAALVILFLINILMRIIQSARLKNQSANLNYENLRQNPPASVAEQNQENFRRRI